MRLYQTLLVCLPTVIAGALPVAAAPATTTWTTYLYQGPGDRYAVVDEVPQATALADADCADGWCKVTLGHRSGYLRADVVAKGDPSKSAPGLLPQPAAALSPKQPAGPCFEADQTGGNGGRAPTIFCAK